MELLGRRKIFSVLLATSIMFMGANAIAGVANSNRCIQVYSGELARMSSEETLKKAIEVLNEVRSKHESIISYTDLLGIKPHLLEYYRSFGPDKQIVIFTAAPSLNKDFNPKSIWNLNRPIKKQTSGIVTVQEVMAADIKRLTGLNVRFVTPEEFGIHYQMKYQEIILSMATNKELGRVIEDDRNIAFHIMVEDGLGAAAKKFLEKRNLPYTTAYHTDFPQYAAGFTEFYLPKPIHKFLNGPKMKKHFESGLYSFLRGFHKNSSGVLVPTNTMANKLIDNNFREDRVRFWSHGVDVNLFRPELRDPALYEQELGFKLDGRPVALFVGRIGEEKNIRDFLDARLVSTQKDSSGRIVEKEAVKVIIGSGPELETLKAEYQSKAYFLGRKAHDTELPKYMASADGFIFPSLTETFGLVGPEALAAGTPTLTYKVQGMQDWNTDTKAGVMVPHTAIREQNLKNLSTGWSHLMQLKREDARAFAETMPWERSILEFLFFINPVIDP